MDFAQLIDIFLHLDKHLAAMVQQWGPWIYAVLFLIIFVETGLVVMPFLPGDSLLFVCGAIAAVGGMDIGILMALLVTAAIAGDALNYTIGRAVGPKVFGWQRSRWFNRDAFDRTHAFYERYGAMTIIIGRFLPFIRTFAPFVAGVAEMTRSKFTLYNVVGALIWVISLSGLGYVFGNTPWVKEHFQWVTLAMIIIPGLPALFEVLRQLLGWLRRRRAATQPGSAAPLRDGSDTTGSR
ncbi:MAG: DedA family protein [Burkholderiaceae bacterium]|jgi:membrane-associated protein